MCALRLLFLHGRFRLFSSLGALVCLIGLIGIQAAQAGDDLPKAVQAAGTAFVQASLARVRAAPDREAETRAWLVTNTQVKLIALRETWCEIESEIPNSGASGTVSKKTHGFVACDLLAAEPLTLALVNAQLARNDLSAKSRLNWYSRAFWIAPSLTRWATVGGAMTNAYLDEATRNQEIVNAMPQRFKVQEFEVMKQRLASGISVTPEAYLAPSGAVEDLDQLPEITEDADHAGARMESVLEKLGIPVGGPDDPEGAPSHWEVPPIFRAKQRISMPRVKPSHFGENEIPVIFQDFKDLGGYGSHDTGSILFLVDGLSAFNGVPFRATVTAPAYYTLHPEIPAVADLDEWSGGLIKVAGAMEVIVGIWDVGGLRVTFEGNAFLYGVTARGEPTARDVREITLGIGYDSSCSYSRTSVDMESKPVAGYAPSTGAILRWVGKPIPGGAGSRATIKTQRLTGKGVYDQVLTHEIDLNRDGVADFLIWQGRYMPQISAEGLWEAVFANIDGHWQLLRYDEDADCT
jgi:hypothetical protein